MPHSRYAQGTEVPVDRTRVQIERVLSNYGCTQFGSGWADVDGCRIAHVSFRHGGTAIMLALPMPPLNEFEWTHRGIQRKAAATQKAYDEELKRRWRALGLVIKAKLEAVECGISTIEREFLSDVVLPNGQTLGSWAVPQLAAIQGGALLLPERSS